MANLDDYIFMKEKKNTVIRLTWSFVYFTLITVTITLVLTLWDSFLNNPTITTLENTYLPVNKISFPGIAICKINKISKKRAIAFAKNISQNGDISFEEALEATRMFANLFDFDYISKDEETIRKMQNILDKQKLNIITIMKDLSPGCNELLKRCRWKGIDINCATTFELSATYDGFCCTFNYVKHTRRRNTKVKTALRGEAGMTRGLSVLIDNEVDDYFASPLNSQGVTIQIFIPTDYPDQTSGSLTQVIAEINTENFLQIAPTTIQTVKEVMNYPVTKRGCLFDEERETKLGLYSQSDCNVDCRVGSILALCQCIPFTIPFATNNTVCTLSNLACLNQYRNKWMSIYPQEDNLDLLGREKHDSLRCEEICYPSCDGTSYYVYSDRAPVHKKRNYTIVNIYYGDRSSHLYKQDVVYYWFEILSNFGGTFSLIMGVSALSFIEFVTFSFQFLRRKCLV